MASADPDWLAANQADLAARLSRLKQRLSGAAVEPAEEAPGDPRLAVPQLQAAFGLSGFESDTLLLCAGIELDSEVPALCATANGDPGRPYPTFSLALGRLPGGHWSALAPGSPLRRWRLIEIGAGQVLTQAPLRIDERVLHFLAGQDQLDERLAVLIDPLPPAERLVPSHTAIVADIAAIWAEAEHGRGLSVVQLCGSPGDCRPLAAAAAVRLGLWAAAIAAERLPTGAADLDSLLRLWEREAALSGLGVLLVDDDDNLPADSDAGRARSGAIGLLLERATSPVILRQREPRRITNRPASVFDVTHPTPGEQFALWRETLADLVPDDALGAVAGQFSLSLPTIGAIAAEARATLTGATPPGVPAAPLIWTLCRRRLRTALDGLAQRISSHLTWDDLVLPDAQKTALRMIAAQVRQRRLVYEDWGFAAKSTRGLGITALLHGPSGTGKTMAAEVIAAELNLDLYHIDLSRMVSKYIGETEANLRRVFDAAEENAAVLLFDEADSLLGMRSKVTDSHDRYANIEVSYLLQRMEAYRGLAILTTNMREAIDPAFLRRIRFAVPFAFPDAPQRAAIWRQVFPPAAHIGALDYDRLAQLRLPGGNIRTIAINAAFLAADAREPIGMAHLHASALVEYAKLDRRLTQAESEAWA